MNEDLTFTFDNIYEKQQISNLLNFQSEENLIGKQLENQNKHLHIQKDKKVQNFLIDNFNSTHINQYNQQKNTQKKDPQFLLRKNLISKNYRDRKKQNYLKLLQQNKIYKQKIQILQQKLNKVQKQLFQTKFLQKDIQKQSYQRKFSNFVDQLRQKTRTNNLTKQQVSKFSSKYNELYGLAGDHKISLLNYFMSQTIDVSLADCQKYLLKCLVKKVGIFGSFEQRTQLDNKILNIMQISSSQELKIYRNLAYGLLSQNAQNYLRYCMNIYDNHVKLLDEGFKMHDKVSKHPYFVQKYNIAMLGIWFYQNRHDKEIKKLKQEWFKMISQKQ